MCHPSYKQWLHAGGLFEIFILIFIHVSHFKIKRSDPIDVFNYKGVNAKLEMFFPYLRRIRCPRSLLVAGLTPAHCCQRLLLPTQPVIDFYSPVSKNFFGDGDTEPINRL